MFQCNEHVGMNNVLCSLACTWMTIIDSQFYIYILFGSHFFPVGWLVWVVRPCGLIRPLVAGPMVGQSFLLALRLI